MATPTVLPPFRPQLLHEQARRLIRIIQDRQKGFLPSIADVDFLLDLIAGPIPPLEKEPETERETR